MVPSKYIKQNRSLLIFCLVISLVYVYEERYLHILGLFVVILALRGAREVFKDIRDSK